MNKEEIVQGIEFRQYADDKTKTFVKAFGKPPKVKIVEDSEEWNRKREKTHG